MPDGFRFAVKLPREISHERKLVDATGPLERLLLEVASLGDKLGPLLLQLPPKLAFDSTVAEEFLTELRARFAGDVVCEPRHPSWFDDEADGVLARFRVARVAADPAPVPGAALPGGWTGLVYRRLHGTPQVYFSAYDAPALAALAAQLRASPADTRESWCIFDNTGRGEAAGNALALDLG